MQGRRTIGQIAGTGNHRMGCRDGELNDGLQRRKTIGWVAETENHRIDCKVTEKNRISYRDGEP